MELVFSAQQIQVVGEAVLLVLNERLDEKQNRTESPTHQTPRTTAIIPICTNN